MRAAVVAEWKEQQTVAWDACSEHVGGAEKTAWEALLKMEQLDFQAGQDGEGVVSLESAVGGRLAIEPLSLAFRKIAQSLQVFCAPAKVEA